MKSFSRVTQLVSRTPSQVCGSPKMVSRTQEKAALAIKPFSPFMVFPLPPALRGGGADYSQEVLIIRVTGIDPIKGIGSRLMVFPLTFDEKLESGACRGHSWAERDRNPGICVPELQEEALGRVRK